MTDGSEMRGAEPSPSAQTVAALFVAFVAVWSLYFAIAESQASIHNDMTEAYAWGRQFQLGYNQHPPFWAWLCGAWFPFFPPGRLGLRDSLQPQRRNRPARIMEADRPVRPRRQTDRSDRAAVTGAVLYILVLQV